MLKAGTARLAGRADNRLFGTVLIFFLVSLATIAAAWGFERFGNYVPCDLCLKQRWAYYFAVPLSALLLRPAADGLKLARWGLVVLAAAMAANALLGIYHSGVEWHWWAGPSVCSTGGGLSGGLPNLDTARVIRCDEAQWRFLGLSFAGWNVVVSSGLVALCLWGMRSTPRREHQGSSTVSQ
jgi:disulfide bond formation protein DsbB